MVMLVVMSTAWPLLVAGRKRICWATRALLHRARDRGRAPRPCTTTWPVASEGDAQNHIALRPAAAGLRRVLHRGLRDHFEIGGSRLRWACWRSAGAAICVGIPAEPPCRIVYAVVAVPVPPGIPAEATLPAVPALEPDLVRCRFRLSRRRRAERRPGPACRHRDCRWRRPLPAGLHWDSALRRRFRPGARAPWRA